MYSMNKNDYQNFSLSQHPTVPPHEFTQTTANGFPVSSSIEFSAGDTPAVFQKKSNEISAGDIPAVFQIQAKPKVPWSTGLCDCTDDVRNCCITCWCPCVTFGQVAEIIDKGSSACGANGALYTLICCVTCCSCCYSCFYRSKMRSQYFLKEKPCGDCLVHCCCEYCALCQEYRELKHQGFDMSIGWHGHMEKQNPGVETAPIVEEGMSRSIGR